MIVMIQRMINLDIFSISYIKKSIKDMIVIGKVWERKKTGFVREHSAWELAFLFCNNHGKSNNPYPSRA